MIEWRRVPWPLWIFAGLTLVGVALVEVKAHGPVAVQVMFPAFMLVYLYFLLRGVRWLWMITIAVGVLGLVLEAIWGSLHLRGLILTLIDLTLLLLPVTRRYFQDRPVAVTLGDQ